MAIHGRAFPIQPIFIRAIPSDAGGAITGIMTAEADPATATFAGHKTLTGVLNAQAQASSADFNGLAFTVITGTLGANAQASTTAFAGTVGAFRIGTLTAAAQPASASFAGNRTVKGTLTAQASASQAAFAGHKILSGVLNANASDAQCDFSGIAFSTITGTLNAVSRPARAKFRESMPAFNECALNGSLEDNTVTGRLPKGGTDVQ